MNLRYYFGFTKGQYKGLILLLTLNLGIIIFYFADDHLYPAEHPHDFSELIAHLDSIDQTKNNVSVDSLYDFDPNRLSLEGFEGLGLEEWIAQRIIKYRSRGGGFRYPVDLLKIYGMDSSWFYKAEPFIKIKAQKKLIKRGSLKPVAFNPNTVSLSDLLKMGLNAGTAHGWVKYLSRGGSFKTCNELEKLYHLSSKDLVLLLPFCELEEIEEKALVLDIYSADSVSLLGIKGIGSTFSHRIIEYRDLLGGFVELNQLMEIYGIDSLKYNQIETRFTLGNTAVKKLLINTDEFKILLKHPYLSYEQVKSIVNYRSEMGPLIVLDELLQLEGFREKDILRLKPYLSFKIN